LTRRLAHAALVLALALPAAAAERAQLPDKYKWNLADLYPSDEAWAQAKEAFPKKLEGMSRHQGKLGESAKALADALADMGALQNELERLYVYAQSRTDQDTRQAKPRAMATEVKQLAVKAEAATAWIRPAILALDEARVRAFVKEDPRLRDWAFFLDNVLRWKPHTLSSSEEKIVAQAGDLATAAPSLHSVLTNADLPWPTVKLASGEAVRLDPAGYHRARTSAKRADREKAFRSFFGAVKGFERTIGAALQAQVTAHVFEKDVRRFDTALEASLFDDAVPVAVYTQLIRDVNANLPTLHRYLALRKKMLGVDRLKYEDLYAPIVAAVDRKYTVEEGIALTLEAVKPLGGDYVTKLEKALSAGWTDFLPATGKRSGAYQTAVYGVHPYMLLNYNGLWNDVSTLAHEAGHTMHTVLAFEKQPYPTSDYAIFVAEVASTLNENFLFRQALAASKDDQARLALLGEHLEGLRTTLFRQTMFAEFELAVHELVERGEALTGEKASEIYLGLVRKYYGHDQGACEVAELYGVEWAYVPHFFNYDFYVFQYATSLVASTSLAKAIREDLAGGKTAARDRYLALLAAGGSDYPVELLKRAGVDMTTAAPFAAAMEEMNATMDEMEKILARGKGGGGRSAGRAKSAASR
jgi:oligoendopeptidase F